MSVSPLLDERFNFPTQKQYRALAAIHRYTQQHGTAPTLDELAHLLGLAHASSAHFRVRALMRAGWVTTGNDAGSDPSQILARALRLTGRGQKMFARLERLYSSSILYGERDLLLNETQFTLAQKIIFPGADVSFKRKGARYILRFLNIGERNYWADLLLEQLS